MTTDIEQLAADIDAIEGWTHNPEDGHPMCAVCGDEYSLHDDCEPTACCDVCVHRMVDKLIVEVRRLRLEADALRQPPHAFNCQHCQSLIEIECVTCSRCVDDDQQVAHASEVSL